jgi:hypothetical protein
VGYKCFIFFFFWQINVSSWHWSITWLKIAELWCSWNHSFENRTGLAGWTGPTVNRKGIQFVYQVGSVMLIEPVRTGLNRSNWRTGGFLSRPGQCILLNEPLFLYILYIKKRETAPAMGRTGDMHISWASLHHWSIRLVVIFLDVIIYIYFFDSIIYIYLKYHMLLFFFLGKMRWLYMLLFFFFWHYDYKCFNSNFNMYIFSLFFISI